jgi:hypothetical protein
MEQRSAVHDFVSLALDSDSRAPDRFGEARRVRSTRIGRRTRSTLFGLFLSFMALPASAQTDVIRGKVTDPEGGALSGVRVSATSIPGSVTRTATTNNSGNYQIAFPGGDGDYMIGFAHVGYGFRQIEVKRVADEAVLIADMRLAPIELDSLIVVASKAGAVNRNDVAGDVSGTERPIDTGLLPADLAGDFAALAASLPGVLLLPGLDGQPDGFSVLGMDGEANSVTLNGAPSSAGSLPRDASVMSSLTTSPFDVSRGGFSGGNLNVTTRTGSNFRTRGLSLVTTTPQMQWTDPAGRALENDYTSLSLGGLASGPLRYNKSFYNVSFQLGRQSRDNRSLLSTSPLGLETAGVAPDSVNRLLGILHDQSVPTFASGARSTRVTDNGSFFAGIDIAPPGSASGQSFGFSLDGNWQRQDPVTTGTGALALPSASGTRTSLSGGLQLRHSGYFGLILSESTAGVNRSQNDADPFLDLPAGRVRVSSLVGDGTGGVQTLTFGGNQGLTSASGTTTASFQNALSWFDNDNKHRLKLSSELQYRATSQNSGANLLGTYTFNSLEDLEAGRPASFSRTLSANERGTGQLIAALALGDSWRRTTDFQVQYGVRADWSHFTTQPSFNPVIESTFGVRNDRIPDSFVLSPRVGFSWTLGESNEIAAFTGAFVGPRAVLRGGIGIFASNPGTNQVGSVLDNTGLASGTQQINCVGPAAPVPNWDAFAADPAAVPDQCADGSLGTVFSTGSPNVTFFGNRFSAPRTIRSNLSWGGSILDARFNLNVEGTFSLNRSQQRSIDLNFNPTQRFSLDDGRPVFVEPTSIVTGTGQIASRAARVSSDFSRVTELRSDMRSRTAQLSVRLSPITRGPSRFSWSGSYTYTNVREQVSGFSNTAGNPLEVAWAQSTQGPHQLSYSLRYNLFYAVQISWSGSLRSGGAFTPMVGGDVNGDGYSNDRAYVYDPARTSDAAVATGMQSLLASLDGPTRECLTRQLGQIASRSSCRAPWSSTASLNLTLDRAKFHMPQRGSISFSLSNPLGAADLLVNGSNGLKGWGQTAQPDGTLLYVRGFDAQTKQYRYEVNQRFGATRPQVNTLRAPVTLTASMRFDLGPTRERQTIAQQISVGRTIPGPRSTEATYKSYGNTSLTNPMSTILRTQDTLRLTRLQADSIARMNRRYLYQTDSIWAPVARFMAALPNEYDGDEVSARTLAARRAQVDLMMKIGPAIRGLLTPEQLRKIPQTTLNYLDPRTLALVRDGTPMYINGSGLSTASALGRNAELPLSLAISGLFFP